MANQLKMAQVQSIFTLHAHGWSGRRIARKLHVDRETVSRWLGFAAQSPPKGSGSNPANAPIGAPGSDGPDPANAPVSYPGSAGSNPANAPIFAPGSAASLLAQTPASSGRASDCTGWREVIQAKRNQGLSARRIHQDLLAEHQAAVGYDSVRRFLRKLGWAKPLPFRRLETAPGEETQVDFGTGETIVGADGKRPRTHVFRVVLSHSRKAYSEATYRQTTEAFLTALENAFRHFGGVPQTVVIDNLEAAVKHPDWFDPELVPRVAAFAAHYGTVILPTRLDTPRHKGKVERGIDYVQENALKCRTFKNLEEQNRHLEQ